MVPRLDRTGGPLGSLVGVLGAAAVFVSAVVLAVIVQNIGHEMGNLRAKVERDSEEMAKLQTQAQRDHDDMAKMQEKVASLTTKAEKSDLEIMKLQAQAQKDHDGVTKLQEKLASLTTKTEKDHEEVLTLRERIVVLETQVRGASFPPNYAEQQQMSDSPEGGQSGHGGEADTGGQNNATVGGLAHRRSKRDSPNWVRLPSGVSLGRKETLDCKVEGPKVRKAHKGRRVSRTAGHRRTRYSRVAHSQDPLRTGAEDESRGLPRPFPTLCAHVTYPVRKGSWECSTRGAVYVRWGRKTCPSGATTVYSGVAGGTHYSHIGGGTNYQCLPTDVDPQWGRYQDGVEGSKAYMYGAEYDLNTNGPFDSSFDIFICYISHTSSAGQSRRLAVAHVQYYAEFGARRSRLQKRPSASGNSVPRRGGGQAQRQPEQGRVEQVQPPNPQGQQDAPQGQQAVPQGQQAAPQGQQAVPQGQQAVPQGQQVVPQGQQAVPQGQQAVPQGQQAVPQGQQAVPQGQQAVPQGQQTVPQGQQAARQEQATAAQAPADPQPGPAARQPQATQSGEAPGNVSQSGKAFNELTLGYRVVSVIGTRSRDVRIAVRLGCMERSVMATLLQEVQELKKQIGAMKQGRTTDDIREELVQFAGRPEAAFDPHRALALVEALVAQARREGHAKAQEYSVILDQIKPLVDEDFFKQLIVNQFGSGLVKQVVKDIAQFVKFQGKMPRGGASKSKASRANMYGSFKGKDGRGGRGPKPASRQGAYHYNLECLVVSRQGAYHKQPKVPYSKLPGDVSQATKSAIHNVARGRRPRRFRSAIRQGRQGARHMQLIGEASWIKPDIRDFERRVNFDPYLAYQKHLKSSTAWITRKRDVESVAAGKVKASADSLMFRDPETVRAGEIHKHLKEWNSILGEGQHGDMIRDWITNGVSLFQFMQPFKGKFKGIAYDCAFPPPRYFPNLPSCEPFAEFVTRSIENRILTGAASIWGRVGVVPPPYLVMALTVEPSKPRLCHDLRYLNLWMKECPFHLDSIMNLTRYVEKGGYQTKCDDKSGYDHVLISEGSKPLVGFQWGGFWFVSNSIPFGWSCSAFVYQTLGNVAMHRIRELGVPSSLYIDDRHAGQLQIAGQKQRKREEAGYEAAQAACFIMCSVVVALGYFLGISKSQLDPVQCLEFLGMEADSVRLAFRLPERKKVSFATLREGVLNEQSVPIVKLQKLTGKLVSFGLAVPAARLYCREMFNAIRLAGKRGTEVRIEGSVREEIQYWRFLDQWEGHVPWRTEKHESIELYSDASGFRWGGSVATEEGRVQFGDYWTGQEQEDIIAVKEAEALRQILLSTEERVRNKRVDALVDNTNVISAWSNQGGKSLQLSRAVRRLWETVVSLNVDLKLVFTPSRDNEADAPSRLIRASDVMLHRKVFQRIDAELGGDSGFDTDLMALPSNVQSARDGKKLRFFSPFPTPDSEGVNVFAQDLTGRNCYAFPPFGLIGALVNFVMQQKARVVMVVPDRFPKGYWWPIVEKEAVQKTVAETLREPSIEITLNPQIGEVEDLQPQPTVCPYNSQSEEFAGTPRGSGFIGVPRLWLPAVKCVGCGYPNDFDFNFCQRCGTPKIQDAQVSTLRGAHVDHAAIDSRLQQLLGEQNDSAYSKQKAALSDLLKDFLKTLTPPKTLDTAAPVDIVKFLIWKDQKGKTKVHETGCGAGKEECKCPCRLAFKTVDTYVGKLRAIFNDMGRGGEWDERLGVGNPAGGKMVKQYLASVTAEQLRQGSTPQQAKPVFLDKIVQVCEAISEKITSEKSAARMFTMARDQAIFKAAFFSGDRMADLLRTRTAEVSRLPSGALVMNHVWGKTLRDGRSNVFVLEKTGDDSTCPVEAIDWYVAIAKYLSIDLEGGYLFRATARNGSVLPEQPSTATINNSFRRHLQKLGIDQGETLHGCRAGCAIALHMAGASEQEVMDHVGWYTKRTAAHYMKLGRVMKPGGAASRLATKEVKQAVKMCERNNELVGIKKAF
ncbi:hypothetical protein Bbelb_420270 [Branchiostoma belcheri]|nr:hypothetical protein Bbelb_420270 [Branchiostoma belcheri]